MLANPQINYASWNYLLGNYVKGNISISVNRYYYLMDLYYRNNKSLKMALKSSQGYWSKWKEWDKWGSEELMTAWDIHRQLLDNEIIVESDYPTYEENVSSARIIGRIIEEKGFKPLYHYSGGKSAHIHVYFDFKCLLGIDMATQQKILQNYTKNRFITKFMEWLREKMISCWGTHIRKFDEQLIKGTHLIRSELSKNKEGYKTFLGYSYKDLTSVPYVCNETNKIQPKLGELVLSHLSPSQAQDLIEEFLTDTEKKNKKQKKLKREANMHYWMNPQAYEGIRPCVEYFLHNDVGDGENRILFVIVNELKKYKNEEEIRDMLYTWNDLIGDKIRQEDINYRLKSDKEYSISCKYIKELLKDIKCEHICKDCKRLF